MVSGHTTSCTEHTYTYIHRHTHTHTQLAQAHPRTVLADRNTHCWQIDTHSISTKLLGGIRLNRVCVCVCVCVLFACVCHRSCPHHNCATCGRSTAAAGGLLFRCLACEAAYCEDHMPDNYEIMGEHWVFQSLGQIHPKQACFILCSEHCR